MQAGEGDKPRAKSEGHKPCRLIPLAAPAARPAGTAIPVIAVVALPLGVAAGGSGIVGSATVSGTSIEGGGLVPILSPRVTLDLPGLWL